MRCAAYLTQRFKEFTGPRVCYTCGGLELRELYPPPPDLCLNPSDGGDADVEFSDDDKASSAWEPGKQDRPWRGTLPPAWGK